MHIFFAFILLIGYIVGRLGHFFYGDKVDFLHHWIYGLLIVLLGFIIDFENSLNSVALISFGLGCFISDFYDFLKFRIYGRDVHFGKKNFLGFD